MKHNPVSRCESGVFLLLKSWQDCNWYNMEYDILNENYRDVPGICADNL